MKIKDRLQQIFGNGAMGGEGMTEEMPTTDGGAALLQDADPIPVKEMPKKDAIGPEEIAKAMGILGKYKEGKTNLEARIIEDQEWYRMRHWKQLRKDNDKQKDMPASAWLFNSIANKHADAMDNYPEAAVLPRELGDKKAAKELSAILPVIFEQSRYKKTYSALWDDMLEGGTGVTGIFWDKSLYGGMGDISIKKVDVLSLYWEPGVEDIQESPNLFFVSLENNEALEEQYPELVGKLGGAGGVGFTQARYNYDDNVDTSEKSEVIEWYYKKRMGERDVLHYCKFVRGFVLYATENETEAPMAEDGTPIGRSPSEAGLYDHGKYPFVFHPLFKIKGTPCGFGYVDVMRDCQMLIDSLDNSIVTNARMGSKRRFFNKKSSKVNLEDYADFTKDFVDVEGSNDPRESIMPIEQPVLPGIYVTVLQNKIAELKETSGNRDFSQGGTTAGVTAASAIAALAELGSKLSRDMITQFYDDYEEVSGFVIELIRQFYNVKRSFRILGEGAMQDFMEFDNQSMQPKGSQNVFGAEMGERVPIFDVRVKAQRQSPFSRMSQNELAMELYGKGFFNPQVADQAAVAVGMMEFEGKDEILSRIEQNGMMAQQIQQMQEQMLMLGQMAEQAHPGSGIVEGLMQQFGTAQSGSVPAVGGASGMETNSLGKPIAGGETMKRAREAAKNMAAVG